MDNQLTLFRPASRGRIHAGRIESSPRLQRVLAVLERGGKWTTRQIVEHAQVMAVSACVAELRANGVNVQCECIARGRYAYWIEQGGIR